MTARLQTTMRRTAERIADRLEYECHKSDLKYRQVAACRDINQIDELFGDGGEARVAATDLAAEYAEQFGTSDSEAFLQRYRDTAQLGWREFRRRHAPSEQLAAD